MSINPATERDATATSKPIAVLESAGVPGVFAIPHSLEEVLRAVVALIEKRSGVPLSNRYHFSPVLPMQVLRQSGYLETFPNLVGEVKTDAEIADGESSRGESERKEFSAERHSGKFSTRNSLALGPAACHHLYPMLTGAIPELGIQAEVSAWCFRAESEPGPFRLLAFRMHEWVFVGSAEMARDLRDAWAERARELLSSVGLEAKLEPASDPFFGRPRNLLADIQRSEGLKFELAIYLDGVGRVAVASANLHRDRLGRAFSITLPSGQAAHSCCVGFGLERLAQALFYIHGSEVKNWPKLVVEELWP